MKSESSNKRETLNAERWTGLLLQCRADFNEIALSLVPRLSRLKRGSSQYRGFDWKA